MQQFTERHVLTVSKPSVVKKVLDAFSVSAEVQGGVSPQTRRWLVEFSKQDFNKLLLNLQVMKTPLGETSAAPMQLDICEMGGVLVLTGQVPEPWVLLAEQLCHENFFPRHPISSFGALVSRAAVGVESGILHIAAAVEKTWTGPRNTSGR